MRVLDRAYIIYLHKKKQYYKLCQSDTKHQTKGYFFLK